MEQRFLWMRPALQKSEAVLMPALPRLKTAEPRFWDRSAYTRKQEDPFRPVVPEEKPQTLALSTYVRPRGSMAGRSVLRAAGMPGDPFSALRRPLYYTMPRKTMPRRGFFPAR